MKKEAIRVSTTIPAAPTTLYYAWLSPEQHSAMTNGAAAKIEPTVGSKFSALNGTVSGKLVILDLGRRLVMAWRNSEFPRDAHDSRVEIHLEALGGGTRITLLQTEIPEGLGEKVRAIWNDEYFGPMRTFFSKFLPDPRNPPPPRRPMPPPEEDDEEEETPPAKPAKGKPSSSKPIIAKPAPAAKAATAKPASGKAAAPPAPPPKSEKKPAKPEPKKAAAKPEPKKAAKPEPKKKPAPPPAKKKAAAPAKAKKPEKKPTKKAEKAKPKKKKKKK